MDKLVTILSPCYNVAPFLPKYFDTVLNQTYSDLQIVLIDDGSTDNTWQVLQEYAAKDSRVEIYHQENQGVSPTRNNLLDKVKGDYVLFVDSDDWIELDMVESLLTLATEHNSPFVMCDRVINDTEPTNAPQSIHKLTQEQAIVDFLHHDYFVGSLCNKLLDSSLLHNERFHCGIWYGEDALFTWAVLQKVNNVVVTSKQLYHYRMNDESISHQSFGVKKLTGHETWRILTEYVETKWPQYSSIVHRTYALEIMHLLQAACQCNYKKDKNVKALQQTLRNNYKYAAPELWLTNKKYWLYMTLIQFWYGFGKLFFYMHRKVRNL